MVRVEKCGPILTSCMDIPELKTKDSIFAELSEKINFEKMSTQVSKLLEVATTRLDELDFEPCSLILLNQIKHLESS